MESETYYVISKSSLLDAFDKARWRGMDNDALIEELELRKEIEEIDSEE